MGAGRRKGKGTIWRGFKECNRGCMPLVWTRPVETIDHRNLPGRVTPASRSSKPPSPSERDHYQFRYRGGLGVNLKSGAVSRGGNATGVGFRHTYRGKPGIQE